MISSPAVPLFSASVVNQDIDISTAVARVISSHWYVLGEEVRQFEREFADYTGTDHCISLANGTDALTLALRAADIGAGDRVALVANAGFYGSTAVHTVGAKPLYVDVDAQSLTMSVAALKSALSSHAKAVIVTHLYGQMADMTALTALCRSHGALLIEDCAQAHGAMHDGKRAGSLGDMAAFSFYPTKNLGALGDGGAITCANPAWAGRVRTLRQYGWGRKYEVQTPLGCNSRLDEMQAAILRTKLPHLDQHNALRRDIAKRYKTAFADLPLQLPVSLAEDYVAHLYVVRTLQRAALAEYLRSCGISSDVHYPIADHWQTAYPSDQRLDGSLPITELACATVLSLPCYPGMAADQVNRVIDAVRGFYTRAKVKAC